MVTEQNLNLIKPLDITIFTDMCLNMVGFGSLLSPQYQLSKKTVYMLHHF